MANKALVDADTGTHYQTKYTYFYIPENTGDTSTIDDDKGLGTILRLGGYSDIETASVTNKQAKEFYPAGYLAGQDDAEAVKASTATNAAGAPVAKSSGILMACDGQILIKSGQKMYVETGDSHHKVNGSHALETTGDLDIAAEGATRIRSKKDLSVTSGDHMKIETAKNKNITLSAGNKTGDVKILSKDYTVRVDGKVYSFTDKDTLDIRHGDVYNYFYGRKVNMAFAATFSISSGINLALFGSANLNIKASLDFTVAATSFSATGVSMSVTGIGYSTTMMPLNTNQTAIDIAALKQQINNLNLAVSSVQMNQSAITTNLNTICVDFGINTRF